MGEGKVRIVTAPVLGIVSLIGFVCYSTVFVYIDGWLGLDTTAGLLNAAIFSWLALMCLFSFFVAFLSDPGGVPLSFAPEAEDPQKDGECLKYCDKCSTYKPLRAHHCRVCKRCVKNAMASTHSMVIFVCIVLKHCDLFGGTSNKIFCVLSGSIICLLSLTLSSLLGWHIYLITHNYTTIEYRTAVRAMWLAKKSCQQYHHRFDLGAYNNLTMILGPNFLKWFWPTAVGHLRDGTHFPVYKVDDARQSPDTRS